MYTFLSPKCVTTWKFFGLDKTKRKEKKFISNECVGCKSGLCYIYKDLYDHDCNSNETVTKLRVNARYVTDDVSHSVARFQVRRPTALNIRNYHLYENEYNSSKYNNEFDIIHYLICFCRIRVDKMMETFVKSVDIEREQYNLLFNNKPVDVIEI